MSSSYSRLNRDPSLSRDTGVPIDINSGGHGTKSGSCGHLWIIISEVIMQSVRKFSHVIRYRSNNVMNDSLSGRKHTANNRQCRIESSNVFPMWTCENNMRKVTTQWHTAWQMVLLSPCSIEDFWFEMTVPKGSLFGWKCKKSTSVFNQ